MVKYIFFIAALVAGLTGCHSLSEKNKPKEVFAGPRMDIKNVNMLYSDSARVKVHMTAPRQLEMDNYDRLFPDGVMLEFFDNTGQKTTIITSKKGRMKYENQIYTVYDSVVVRNLAKNEIMNTEELNWQQREQKVFTEKHVAIRTPEELLEGEGLDAKQDFSWYRIRKPTGVFPVEQKK